ncbi:MAG: hypothetical protein ACXVCX_19250, partial [Ktedonobacterales bacterium]
MSRSPTPHNAIAPNTSQPSPHPARRPPVPRTLAPVTCRPPLPLTLPARSPATKSATSHTCLRLVR